MDADQFLGLLAGWQPGHTLTANDLPEGAYRLLGSAAHLGYLHKTGETTRSSHAGTRGKRVSVYVRTELQTPTMSCVVCGARIRSSAAEAFTRYTRRRFCSRDCQYVGGPEKVGPDRTLLARTCRTCGDLIGGRGFSRTATGWSPTCGSCANRRFRSAKPPAWHDEQNRRKVSRRAGTWTHVPTAYRSGEEWTGAEMELLGRSDLDSRQLAALLSRTPYAVSERRRLLRIGDPTLAAFREPRRGGRQ